MMERSNSESLVVARLRTMLTIRRFEERLVSLKSDERFPGHYHLAIGQEATAVASAEQLRSTDTMFTTHRSHGHLLAKGADPARLFAEIMGRSLGYSRGKGGTLHLAAAEIGVPYTSALVGGSVPVATGAAYAARERSNDEAVVCFFGDGVFEEGAVYEAFNIGALWNLPILYVCENNDVAPEERAPGQYPSSSHSSESFALLVSAFGIDSTEEEGDDIEVVSEVIQSHLAAVREGRGPRFVELRTTRWPGSYPLWPELPAGPTEIGWLTGESSPPQVMASWTETSDPIARSFRRAKERGQLDADGLTAIDREALELIDRAVEDAEKSPYPEIDELFHAVYKGSSDG